MRVHPKIHPKVFQQAVDAWTKWPAEVRDYYLGWSIPTLLQNEALDDTFRYDMIAIKQVQQAGGRIL